MFEKSAIVAYKEVIDMQDIEFNDEFEEESDICSICGGETVLTGWNEEKELSRFECADCGGVVIVDSKYNEIIIKGEERDWLTYLTEHLVCPFDARVDEAQGDGLFEEDGPVRYGDKIVVKKVNGEDELYGVIADIKKRWKTYHFPLCDLAVEDKKSANYKVLDHYRNWFTNCR
jgi:hypothetical protein